jgi:bifunctional UDP-N-acetylglucosamine pyrophosphorylase/glucosamine-1-phosphate N-acetyltransferase
MTVEYKVPALIILAGGASSRMWPIREKSLLRFGAEPLLAAQLHRYAALGFERAVIVANPDTAEDILLLAAGIPELSTQVVVQQEPRGMGDAILTAATALGVLDGLPVMITQVHDVVEESLFAHILERHRMNPAESLITGAQMSTYFPGGYLIVDESQRITGIVEKPGAENRPSNFVNVVVHLLADARSLVDALLLEYASGATTDDHYERALDALMRAHTFRIVPYTDVWKALKYPWHVLDVMNVFLGRLKGQHIGKNVFISDRATISGDVFIGEGAKLFPGSAVVGPAYIGAGTVVGNNALVRSSMVLDHCEVGFTTEVARSYVADSVSMHACRVLDSVLMSGVNFSAGCTTANLRIDHGNVASSIKGQRIDSGRDKLGAIIGANTFVSVDVMTMPGVKIGAGSEVGPGTHVHQDIPDGMRVYVKQELITVSRKES